MKTKYIIILSLIPIIIISWYLFSSYFLVINPQPLQQGRCFIQGDFRCADWAVNEDGTFVLQILPARDATIQSFTLSNENCNSYKDFEVKLAEIETLNFDCGFKPDFPRTNLDIEINYTTKPNNFEKTLLGEIKGFVGVK